MFIDAPTDDRGEQMWAIIFGPQRSPLGSFIQHQRSWYFQTGLNRWASRTPNAGFEMQFGSSSPDYAFTVWALMRSGKVVTMTERASDTWLRHYAPSGFVRDTEQGGAVEPIAASSAAWGRMRPQVAGGAATPFLVCRPMLNDFVRPNGERCTSCQQITSLFAAYCMDATTSGSLTDGLMLRPADDNASWSTIALFVDHEGITRPAIANDPGVIARIPERT